MVEAPTPRIEKDPSTQFAERLDTILFKKVSVENIGTFADEALGELVALNESVVAKYQAEYPESDAYVGVELEDQAYRAYSLENLNAILTRVSEMQENIGRITLNVSESLNEIDTVITPPDPSGPALGGDGSGTYEKPQMLDRLVTLTYILERDFDLNNDDVRYTKGTTNGNMLRTEPYVRVEIDSLKRIVYVCDEEGNASYVFDTVVLEQLGITPPELDVMSKNQRNALLRVQPEAGARIIQSPQWREVMSQALSSQFSRESVPEVSNVRISEFFGKAILPYEDFLVEVRTAYEQAGRPNNVAAWYRSEYPQHKDYWPYGPSIKTYQDQGFNGLPDMVGNEVVELLSYEDFLAEVRVVYGEAGKPKASAAWYKKEYKKHKGWPAVPIKIYKNSDYDTFAKLVGNEKVKILPYADFLREVLVEYERPAKRPTNVHRWYQDAYKQHRGWPSSPHTKYSDAGFSSYPEMVGNEVVEFLPYEDFLAEVRTAYEKAAKRPLNVQKWYHGVYKNHKGWPSEPYKTYRNNGFNTYPEMVRSEVVEFIPYEDFLVEVRTAYEEAGRPSNIQAWYQSEYKQRRGWPAKPESKYKNGEFDGYRAMVND